MVRNKRAHERGVTLIELLAALLIIGFVALGIAGVFTRSMHMNASGMDYIQATNLARDRLEQLMSLPFTAAAISHAGWTVDDPRVRTVDDTATLPARFRDPDVGFTRTYTVRELRLLKTEVGPTGSPVTWEEQMSQAVDPGTGNIKEITVTVASQNPRLVGRREIIVSGLKPAGL